MTRKEQILRMMQKLPNDVSYDQVIYKLDTMRAVEIGLAQIERGEVIEDDDLVQQWREKGWLDGPESAGPPRRKPTSQVSKS